MDTNGKRLHINKTVYGGIREAQRIQRELLAERDGGTLKQPAKESLALYLTRWLESHRSSVKERTFISDKEMIQRYVVPFIGTVKLDQIKPLNVQKAYDKLGINGLSPSTIRRVHATLNNAMKQAVRWQLISQNPCEHVTIPKLVKKEMRALNEDEAVRFMNSCACDQYGVMFRFMLLTGCRPGEAFGLQWHDLDFTKQEVSIRRTLTRKGGGYRLTSPKTNRGNRQIHIYDKWLLADLKELRTEAKEKALHDGLGFDDKGFVFTTDTGTPVHDRNIVQRHFKPLLKHAGISSDVRLYDLRHSTASLLLRLNVHPKVVAEMLGHSDITLTLNTYSHVVPTLQKDAAEQLAHLLDKS